MKIIQKSLKLATLIFLVLIIINFFPAFFYKKEINNNTLPSEYVKGVYHIHSLFSDGLGSVEDITTAAGSLGLDFVILTDHGVPNLNCANSTSYKGKVLLIGASEFSLDCGHLAAAGFKIRDYKFPLEPQESINEVNDDDGVTFVAHPFDGRIPWTDWDIKNFTGIEILNSYSCAKKIGFLGIFSFPLEYLVNKDYSLLETVYYPQKNLDKWDMFNRNGRYMGIFALDAHSKLPITKKILLRFPSYYSMFRIFNVYVRTGEQLPKDPFKASKRIIRSIKAGHFFSAIEGLSSANGFDSYFDSTIEGRINMGDISNTYEGKINIILPFDFRTNIILRRDGRIIKRIRNNIKNELKINIGKPGVYRSEIFITDSRYSDLPWIVTNPFFLGKPQVNKISDNRIILEEKQLVRDHSLFHIENNPSSKATLNILTDEKIKEIKYTLKKEDKSENYWVSLALRKKLDFSGFNSISFYSRSEKNMRYWLELRTGEGKNELWYRHSFLSGPKWRKNELEFKKFHCINKKDSDKIIDISNINSLFISINNSIVFNPDISGTLLIKSIKLLKFK